VPQPTTLPRAPHGNLYSKKTGFLQETTVSISSIAITGRAVHLFYVPKWNNRERWSNLLSLASWKLAISSTWDLHMITNAILVYRKCLWNIGTNEVPLRWSKSFSYCLVFIAVSLIKGGSAGRGVLSSVSCIRHAQDGLHVIASKYYELEHRFMTMELTLWNLTFWRRHLVECVTLRNLIVRRLFGGSKQNICCLLFDPKMVIVVLLKRQWIFRKIIPVVNKWSHHKGKGKAIPVTCCGGPYDWETSRLPHFLDNRLTDGCKVVTLTRLPPFTLRKISGILFC
jgi:hypothetical protein